MIIQHNLLAMNNQRLLGTISTRKRKITEQLSSGFRINRAADNACGLSISEKMRNQIRGLGRASLNAQDGISLCQTAEGALHEVHNMLHRMEELSVQAANDTNHAEDRSYLQDEVEQLKKEFDRIAATTTFNNRVLLDGSLSRQTGATNPKQMVTSSDGLQSLGTNGKIITVQSTTNEMPSQTNIVIMESLKADQTTSGTTSGGSDALKNLLKNELVPNAVDAIVDTFSETFGYLRGSEIGIGLTFKNDSADTVLASVSSNVFLDKMFYSLTVNTAYYDGTEESRTALERTIAHEMMHALMSEALTSGMTGVDQDDNTVNGFPSWFVEGTAQLISGAFEENNNWIEALGLEKSHTETDIEDHLNFSFNKLGSGTGSSEYGTGYLATMYLGYLIGGEGAVNASSIAKGVDALLNTVRGGSSLDKTINDLTKYDGYQDFLNQFSKDAAPFIKELLNTVGTGTGSLITGDFTDSDLLPNGAVADSSVSKLFELNTTASIVVNDYFWNHPDHIMIEGGSLYNDGAEGMDYVPSNVPQNPGGTDPDSVDPNPGGNGTDPVDPNPGGGGTDPVDPNPGGGGTDPADPNPGGGGTDPVDPNPGGGVTPLQGGIKLQIGANPGLENSMTIYLPGVSSRILGISQIDLSTWDGTQKAITAIQKAVDLVSAQRSEIGAYQNRLEHTIKNLDNIAENTAAAESRIRDTDMAKAMVEYSKLNILEQAATAILSQATHLPEGVLSLLR